MLCTSTAFRVSDFHAYLAYTTAYGCRTVYNLCALHPSHTGLVQFNDSRKTECLTVLGGIRAKNIESADEPLPTVPYSEP